MDRKIDRLDMILAHMKKVEPTPAFETEFKRRLGQSAARRYEEKPLDKILRRIGEGAYNLRNALMPEPLVLTRIAATFVVVISVGLYVYSSQPALPGVIASEGVVMVQGAKDAAFKKVCPAYKFRVGDIVTVRKGAEVDIGLSNKYAMRLKGGTHLRIAKLTPRYGNGKVFLELAVGKVLVDVNKEGFKGSKFEVRTPTALAGVRGTKFSIDVSRKDKPKSEIDVLEGRVEVKSRYRPEKILLAKQIVTVDAGQKTDVYADKIPTPPQRLMEEEWAQLEELYQIGKKPQVILLIKNTPDRVMQLLKPCPIYITDEKPRQIPELLEKAVLKIAEAVRTKDAAKHLEGIKTLQRIVREHPNPKYDVQLLLYIGAYYEYLDMHEDAINSFREVLRKYPDSPLASMAQCAIGVIYEEKIGDLRLANEAYNLVLRKYPNSLEAILAEERLGIKKAG
ncbi:MAG: FecR domain-containing protein [Candidatus Omnitrophota bacterium]